MALRVLLADDNVALLRAITEDLRASPGIEVVGTAYDGAGAAELATSTAPDVAIIDVEMLAGGPELAARLLALRPSLRVLCLTARDDEQTVLRMLAAGATGYVVKGSLDEDLATYVRRAAAGALFVVAGCVDGVRDRIGSLTSA